MWHADSKQWVIVKRVPKHFTQVRVALIQPTVYYVSKEHFVNRLLKYCVIYQTILFNI